MIAAGGLIGKLTSVTGGTSEVRLITDGQSGVSAQVFPAGVSGVVRPEVGNPDDLLLEHVESGRRVTENTLVVTSGFTSSRTESLFPRGIPIGRVTKVDLDELETYQRVHVKPFADMRRIDLVQVLTRRGVAQQAASVPEARADDPVVGAFVRVGGPAAGGRGAPAVGAQPARPVRRLTPTSGRSRGRGGRLLRRQRGGLRRPASAPVCCSTCSPAHMGASSLVLTAVGYGVGRFREVRDPSHGLLPVAVGTLATAGWVVAFAAVALMLDIGARVSPLVLRDMIMTMLLNALLALPVFTGCRKLLRPSLAVDPLELRRRRRPPREAGPLGLRGLGDRPTTRMTPIRRHPRPGSPPAGFACLRSGAPPEGRPLMYLDNERRPTLTPQLAVRVAMFGGIALAAFAVMFFRLWFLQVLSSDAYVKEAQAATSCARSACSRRAATSSTARAACW